MPSTGRVTDRYYTAEQARDGAQLFAVRCAICHGASLQGIDRKGPALVGPPIRARRWKLALLFSYVSHEMPANARGSLSQREYLSLVAFLLQRNGHPAGPKQLSPTLLKNAPKRL